ncbi:MAG: aminotransferase class V-fold PLP-dependent enzyme [Pirellulaceae bacterium]
MGTVPSDWTRFRDQMPVTRRWSYLDNAAVAPLPAPTRAAIQHWLDQAADEGDTCWGQWRATIERGRTTAAQLIGADPDEIAFVANTTTGIGLVAEGFPWQPGDNVVTLANEFPTNQYPWMNLADRGVETRRVAVEVEGPVDVERIAQYLDRRTRVLSISWVGFGTGWRVDLSELAALAHRYGARLFVDAIQGLGVFPLDVSAIPIDFLAADGHKWLLGPEGAGLFYVRREHLDLLRPVGVGWNSVAHASDYGRIEWQPRPTAARYEGGSYNMAGLIGLAASLQFLADQGLSPTSTAIADRVLALTDYAVARLHAAGAVVTTPRLGAHRSGIVAFEMPGRDSQALRRQCLDRQVVLACRGGRLRISPHAYANEADLDRLLTALDPAY